MLVEPEDNEKCARCGSKIEWGYKKIESFCYDCLKREVTRIERVMRKQGAKARRETTNHTGPVHAYDPRLDPIGGVMA